MQHSAQKWLVKGSDEWQLHPRLHPLGTDHIVHKRHGNAFVGTTLQEELETLRIRRLVVTGLVTHGCVRATCMGAHKLGYQVILVSDGHSSFHKQAGKLIEEWNQKLSEGGVELKSTRQINFRKKT